MLKFVNLQLNTDAAINRDLDVELISEASGARKSVKPYLDGSVRINDLEPGGWRVVVKHPNMIHSVLDRRITVLPDRPTFIPLQIPKDIFSKAAIRDTPEADLAPEMGRFDEVVSKADQQAKKVAGQPIFAADWNSMAGTLGDVARTTRDLAQKVSPLGHDHPELVEKLDELQANLERFFDVFGQTVVQLQRQIQQLALRQQTEATLDKLPDMTPAKREEVTKAVEKLAAVSDERSDIYTREVKRAGEQLHAKVMEAAGGSDALMADKDVSELLDVAREMSKTPAVKDYKRELESLKRIESAGSGKNLTKLFGR
ncbi:hypothetical protein ACNOYE_28305 [Nannocystaceae bacterium ST9]